jgi:bacteriocin biosynthesis cyclodehydratase domain-containing protein
LERPRIKLTTEKVDAGADVLLIRPSRKTDVRIEHPDTDERRLLDWLDGTRSMSQLKAEFGDKQVDEALSEMDAMDLLEDAAHYDRLPHQELARFDRQLRYFADVATGPASAPQCQAKLREAKVAILGLGGLGGWSAWTLACLGLGELRLIDSDQVEISNLNRQTLYTIADVGRSKAECAGERLGAFDPATRIDARADRLENESEISEFIDGVDVVVGAADWPAHEIEDWCNAACFKLRIPYITMSHFPPIARVGPFFVPGKTGCFACHLTALRRQHPELDLVIDHNRGKPSPAATIGPACALIGAQVGLDILHLVTGLTTPSTLGAAHIYDLRTMEVQREPVVRDPECRVCGQIC